MLVARLVLTPTTLCAPLHVTTAGISARSKRTRACSWCSGERRADLTAHDCCGAVVGNCKCECCACLSTEALATPVLLSRCCNVLSAVLAAAVVILYFWTIISVRDNMGCCEGSGSGLVGGHPCSYQADMCSNTTTTVMYYQQGGRGNAYGGGNAGSSSRYSSGYNSNANANANSNSNTYSRGNKQNYYYTQETPLQKQRRCDCDYWTKFNTQFVQTLSDDDFYLMIVYYIIEFVLAVRPSVAP